MEVILDQAGPLESGYGYTQEERDEIPDVYIEKETREEQVKNTPPPSTRGQGNMITPSGGGGKEKKPNTEKVK